MRQADKKKNDKFNFCLCKLVTCLFPYYIFSNTVNISPSFSPLLPFYPYYFPNDSLTYIFAKKKKYTASYTCRYERTARGRSQRPGWPASPPSPRSRSPRWPPGSYSRRSRRPLENKLFMYNYFAGKL